MCIYIYIYNLSSTSTSHEIDNAIICCNITGLCMQYLGGSTCLTLLVFCGLVRFLRRYSSKTAN